MIWIRKYWLAFPSILETCFTMSYLQLSRTNPMGLLVPLDDDFAATGSLFWDDGESQSESQPQVLFSIFKPYKVFYPSFFPLRYDWKRGISSGQFWVFWCKLFNLSHLLCFHVNSPIQHNLILSEYTRGKYCTRWLWKWIILWWCHCLWCSGCQWRHREQRNSFWLVFRRSVTGNVKCLISLFFFVQNRLINNHNHMF